MSLIQVGCDRMHFFDEGIGVPVVFIHGSCGGGRQWQSLATPLLPQYRVLRPDLVGCGASGCWPIGRRWTVQHDVAALDAMLDQLGEPFHLVAHSHGAHAAYQIVRRSGSQLLGLTLFEPTYFHLLRLDEPALFREPLLMAQRYRGAIEVGDYESGMRGFVDTWAQATGTWDGLTSRTRQAMRQAQGRLYDEWMTIFGDEPSLRDLAAIDVPVLLIKGEKTLRSVHKICDLIRTTVSRCTFVEIEGAAHQCPFTHASVAFPVLLQHLEWSEASDSMTVDGVPGTRVPCRHDQ
jgi:pimeloyl-ACP methyl ester carboxylesterase